MTNDNPTMQGNSQEITVSGLQAITFINMGNTPIAVTAITFFVDQKDEAGKTVQTAPLELTKVQPFTVGAGEIITKNMNFASNPPVFKPTATNGSKTMTLRAGFALVTPEGSTYRGLDLGSDLVLPPSGTSIQLSIVVHSAEAPDPLSLAKTLYHNWHLVPFWWAA